MVFDKEEKETLNRLLNAEINNIRKEISECYGSLSEDLEDNDIQGIYSTIEYYDCELNHIEGISKKLNLSGGVK